MSFCPGFGFFVKIHLLESLKLDFYDFRNYSFMIIFFFFSFFGNIDCMKCVDGF